MLVSSAEWRSRIRLRPRRPPTQSVLRRIRFFHTLRHVVFPCTCNFRHHFVPSVRDLGGGGGTSVDCRGRRFAAVFAFRLFPLPRRRHFATSPVRIRSVPTRRVPSRAERSAFLRRCRGDDRFSYARTSHRAPGGRSRRSRFAAVAKLVIVVPSAVPYRGGSCGLKLVCI